MSVVHRFTGTESNFLWENVKIQNYESGSKVLRNKYR